jgi:hypothetical protein
MQWLKKYLSVWKLGFVLIALSVIDMFSMIPEILGSPDPTKYVLAVSIVIGTSLVAAYLGTITAQISWFTRSRK